MRSRLLNLYLVAAAIGLLTGSARAEEIGTTAAVVPATRGRPTGGVERVLTLGTKMMRDEKVMTDVGGSTQILFTDGSAINIGPSSSLVLDRYVFDAQTNTGAMAVTLGKGALRFVGGKISKTETVTIDTPLGTVGIRGGVAQVEYSADGGLTARFLYGEFLTVSTRDTVSTTTRAGTAIDLRQGTPPSGPRPMTPAEVSQSTARTMTASAAGGAGSPPPGATGAGPPPSRAGGDGSPANGTANGQPSMSSQPGGGQNGPGPSGAIEAAAATMNTALPPTTFSSFATPSGKAPQGTIASGQPPGAGLPAGPVNAPLPPLPAPIVPIVPIVPPRRG